MTTQTKVRKVRLIADGANSTIPAAALDLLTRRELAGALKCSLRQIDKLQQAGVPRINIGASKRFILTEVLGWLRRKGGAL